jgi:hypothetical protein
MKAKTISDKLLINISHSPNTFFLEKLVLYAFSVSGKVKHSILVEYGLGFNELPMPLPFSSVF